jgi:hypothetical protein
MSRHAVDGDHQIERSDHPRRFEHIVAPGEKTEPFRSGLQSGAPL